MTTTESCYQKLSNLIAAIDQEWHPESQGQHFTTELCNAIDAARAAADDLPVSAWQPIETAPGDGTEVFVWDGAKAVVAVSEHDFFGDVIHWPIDEWGDKRLDQPPVHGTHWQPRLRPPPITP